MNLPTFPVLTSRRLGAYEVQDPIGSGATGVVYRALDTRLNRPVAIKLLSARRRRRRGTAPLSAGSADGLLPQPSPHPHGLRRRRMGRPPLSRHRVGRRRHPEGVGGRGRATWRQIVDLLSASPTAWRPRTRPGSCTATSSPKTSSSPRTATRSSPTSDWQSWRSERATTQHVAGRAAHAPASFSARSPTCRRSRRRASRSTRAATSSPSAWCSTRLLAGSDRSPRQPTSGPADDHPSRARLAARRCTATAADDRRQGAEKDPADRYQTPWDLVVDLRRATRARIEEPGHAAATRTPRRVRHREQLAWLVAAAATIVAGVVFFTRAVDPAPRAPLSLSILPPNSTSGIAPEPMISADATRVAFKARNARGQTTLWVRALDSAAVRELDGTEGALLPFCRLMASRLAFSRAANSSGSISRAVRRVSWPTLRIRGAERGAAQASSSSFRRPAGCTGRMPPEGTPDKSPVRIRREETPATACRTFFPTASVFSCS